MIIRALENILTGPMREELENFKSLVRTLKKRGKTVLDDAPEADEYAFDSEMDNIQQFMRYARTLHLHVLNTEYAGNMARSVVVYHNEHLLIQEQRELILEKSDSVWKIKEIRDVSRTLNQT